MKELFRGMYATKPHIETNPGAPQAVNGMPPPLLYAMADGIARVGKMELLLVGEITATCYMDLYLGSWYIQRPK